MRYSKFKKHMLTLSLVSLISMIVLLFVIVWHLYSAILKERKILIHSQVDTVMSLMHEVYEDTLEGKLTKVEAQHQFLEYIEKLKYSDNGYFWVLNTKGVMLMHPYNKSSVGQSLIHSKDKDGKFFVKAFITTTQHSGSGFVSYYWTKPGDDVLAQKLSYVALFKPWGWIVGTGLYVSDLNREIVSQIYIGLLIIIGLFLLSIFVSLQLYKRYLTELREVAIFDRLTRLYRRSYLDEIGPRMLKEEHSLPLSVIFFDIDFFKKVNDQYGHNYGDNVLSAISSIIQKELLPHKNVFRYGGEEMVALLHATEEECRMFAEKVRFTTAEHVFHYSDSEHFHITISAGVAIASPQDSFSDIVRRADRCMYFAKARGRNKVVTESEVRGLPDE
ncbi:cache domain-containing protein [Marinomonas arenicola]|uniref:diguanylate cyclase n=1 Tax=Marinomonas arenicola TaxID=569601 RepID=A0ABU9G0P4_9GAMM